MRISKRAASSNRAEHHRVAASVRGVPFPAWSAMKIAIIGTGAAGLAAAHALHREHDLTLFEAGEHAGGHADTIRVELDGRAWPVDIGFMVYNETTYPRFTRLLSELGVATRPTSMGFSVSDPAAGVEYCGTDWSAIFAWRRNLVRPAFLRMLADIARFNRDALTLAEAAGAGATLGDLVERGGFGESFRRHYLVPMAAAIWSASERDAMRLPAGFFVRFFRNHGLLEPPHRQWTWRTVIGGSAAYVDALCASFRSRLRLRTPVRQVRRVAGGVDVRVDDGVERFDEVVLATSVPRALRLVADPTPLEREVLGAFRTQVNVAVVHTDTNVLPRRRRAWASWNYHVPAGDAHAVRVTYDLSRLQGHATSTPILLTLNGTERIDPARVLATRTFEHPVFTTDAIAAQARHAEVSGRDRIHYCAAAWRNGFHEDAHESGARVAPACSRAGVPA